MFFKTCSVVLFAVSVTACAARNRIDTTVACEQLIHEEALVSDSTVGSLAGSYLLQVSAESGPQQGASTRASLTLIAMPESLQTLYLTEDIPIEGAWAPFFGFSDMEPGKVGAVDTRPSVVADSTRTDALVVASRNETGAYSIVIRLGTSATGPQPIEGGYFVFDIKNISDQGFAGEWRSGMGNERVDGIFCAIRKE